jgi:hypothetical protein
MLLISIHQKVSHMRKVVTVCACSFLHMYAWWPVHLALVGIWGMLSLLSR